MTENHLNTSPHALMAAYIPHIRKLVINDKNERIKSNSVNLDKIDKQKYQELLKDRLAPIVATEMPTESVNTLAETITDVLVKTAEECVLNGRAADR